MGKTRTRGSSLSLLSLELQLMNLREYTRRPMLPSVLTQLEQLSLLGKLRRSVIMPRGSHTKNARLVLKPVRLIGLPRLKRVQQLLLTVERRDLSENKHLL